MKAETCTFEVVSLIMYYKQINEKLTCIRKRHTKGGQITHTSLFLYLSDYMQFIQPVRFVPFEFVPPPATDNKAHEIRFYHPCASCTYRHDRPFS